MCSRPLHWATGYSNTLFGFLEEIIVRYGDDISSLGGLVLSLRQPKGSISSDSRLFFFVFDRYRLGGFILLCSCVTYVLIFVFYFMKPFVCQGFKYLIRCLFKVLFALLFMTSRSFPISNIHDRRARETMMFPHLSVSPLSTFPFYLPCNNV